MEPGQEAAGRVAEALRAAVKGAGFSLREVDKRMGWSDGYLSQLIRGNVDLKLFQLLGVLGVVGVDAGRFWAGQFGVTTDAHPGASENADTLNMLTPHTPQPIENAMLRLVRELEETRTALKSGQPKAQPIEDSEGTELFKVPLLSDPIAAGNPILAEDQIEGWRYFVLGFRKSLGDTPVLVRVEKSWLGESMMPEIRPGSLIALDRGPDGRGVSAERFRDGRVYAVRTEDGLTLKQVFRDKTDGSLLICESFNRDYAPFTVPIVRGQPLGSVLVGRMVWKAEEDL